MKIKLKNTSLVEIGGKLPGATFKVEAVNATTPKDLFWRKRVNDNDGIVLVEAEVKTPKNPPPESSKHDGSGSRKTLKLKQEAGSNA